MMDILSTDTVSIDYCDDQGNCGTALLVMTFDDCDGGGIIEGPIEEEENEGTENEEEESELLIALENDEYEVLSNSSDQPLNVISNDLLQTDIHTIELIFSPVNGEAYFNSNHQLIYTPNADFEGIDNMIYEICYDNGTCDDAVIYLNVRRDDPAESSAQCLLEIYNGVSPNNDGMNDAFTINGLECYDYNKLIIFNKKSQILYQTEDYQNDWKGINMNDDSELEEGTYYYILEVNRSNRTTYSKGFLEIQK